MRWGVGGAVAAVLVGLASLAPTASGTTHEDAAVPTAEVLITSITPQVLSPGEDLRVRGTLRNTGSTPIAEPRVTLHLSDSQFISRYSLDRWRAAGTQGALGSTVQTIDLEAPLAPGASVPVDLLVPAAAVGLPSMLTSWGARGLAVQVVDRADPAAGRLAVTRTFALWFPDQQVNATRLSILVPITGPALDPGGSWTATLDESTRPGGRLATLLAATGAHPEVTWIVDPWLVDAAPIAGGSAPGWAAELVQAMTDREVHLLPYTDPDLAALAHAGAGELLTTATRRAHAVAASPAFPDGARVSIAWPADPLPDQATAALANRDRARALLVGPGELLPPAVLTYTPSGRTQVTVAGEEVTVLVPDERLSGALVTGRVLTTDAEPSQVTGATAAQDLLAELAVITRERPSDGRHLLVTVPRDWSPDPAVVDAQLSAILDAPWVHAEPVTALIGAADPEIDRGTLPSREVARTEVSPAELDQVNTAVDLREQIAGIVADPESLLGDLELELLAPTSVAWREDPVGRAAAVNRSRVATERLRAGVSVQPGPVLLVSTSGGMPVDVINDLEREVTVHVALVPGDRRLVADEVVPATVPPGGLVTVVIPVHAVQSADVDVTVELRTPDGLVIDDSSHFTVRVRAEWEGIGTAVIAGLLGVGLIIGLFRTIRRGRAGSRVEPQAQSGPDTLSPEEDAELGRVADDVRDAGRAPTAEPDASAAPPHEPDASAVPPHDPAAGEDMEARHR